MINKIATSVGKFVAKKTGNKAVEKISEPYEKLNRTAYGIRPLNVGEEETIKCLQNPRNSLSNCKSVGTAARRIYQKTGKYK